MDILCIYYPEWHVYPEGEAIFGKGRTEWDYVDSAVPRFPGHEQPLRLLAGHLNGEKRTNHGNGNDGTDHGNGNDGD